LLQVKNTKRKLKKKTQPYSLTKYAKLNHSLLNIYKEGQWEATHYDLDLILRHSNFMLLKFVYFRILLLYSFKWVQLMPK